jgi:hypothetical protein
MAAALAVLAQASRARAQPAAQGFAVERFYPSAAGGGWFVMDALELDGGLGGALGLTFDYARDPLRIPSGVRRLAVVSSETNANVGAALGYGRFRLYLDLTAPVGIRGQSGTADGSSFTGPSLDLGRSPDVISDARIGFDARLVGRPRGPFRLGAGVQLFIPSGSRADYDTDGTFRGMFRALFAGDAGAFTYAGHVGVHLRPLDDASTPGSPRGQEMIFGLAAGAKLPLGRGRWTAVIGPEVWGATPFRSFFGAGAAAVEGLMGTRFEGPVAGGPRLRVKLGAGVGNHELGTPGFRFVLGFEASGAITKAASKAR